jgi:aminoglycoside phosphotransferase (APT) family kinase protein
VVYGVDSAAMSEHALHRDEVVAGPATVRHLVDTQFPAGRALPLARLRSAGTDNVMYRLGGQLLVRLPRRPGSVGSLETELRWLPELAPQLPVAVPVPVCAGQPDGDYPWPWAVYRWLPGDDASTAVIEDEDRFARELAEFVRALHAVDVAGIPVGERPHWYRCDPLYARDRVTREDLEACGRLDGFGIDVALAARVWEEAMALPPSHAAPCWVHADLMPFNLLVAGGGLGAVIDFGGLAIGDPAIDLAAPWGLLSPAARSVFYDALGADEVERHRARAWVLSLALGLRYYWDTHPPFTAYGLRCLREVLDDYRQGHD